jgi:hypothetical protein
MLSTYLYMPREGHMDAVVHVVSYLVQHHNLRVAADICAFIKTDWKSMYGDVKEVLPSGAPVPHGKEVDLRLFVDSDHAGEQLTLCSMAGFVTYLNMSPIVWFWKHQPTVESIVFGAEFVVMEKGIETCHGLRYKMRMMGFPLSGLTSVYGNIILIVHSTQCPESVLKKKSNSISYHVVRESTAMRESTIGHVPSVENPADICKKVVSSGKNQHCLMILSCLEVE